MLLATVILTLSAPWVEFISVFLLPAVNNFVTKLTANNWLKIVVSAVTAFLVALLAKALQVDGSAIISTDLIIQTVLVFLGQTVIHRNIYKPNKIPERLAPNKGLG